MKNLVKSTLKSLAVACLLYNINPFDQTTVKADQPVHCLREQMFGVWNFHVSKDQGKVNLFQTNEICSHNIPNKVQLVNKEHLFQFGQEDIYRVNIMENYKAEAVFCPNDKKCQDKVIPGKWTSIYDQAFNVELDNGLRFIANFRYNLKPELSKDPFSTAQQKGIGRFSQIQSGDYDKFDSQCNKTMVGFIQNIPAITGQSFTMTEHHVQCFHAVQEKQYKVEDTKEYNTGKVKFNKITAHHDVKKEDLAGEVPQEIVNGVKETAKPKLVQRTRQKRKNLHLSHRPSDEMDLLIEEVNKADLGWKADVCKYQKHHANYGSHCAGEELLLAQTKDDNLQVSDDAADAKKFGDRKDPKFNAAFQKVQQFMKKYKNSQDIPDNELPDTLDFRNVDGYDFTSQFRDQGHCGSCYTISMTQVMEARMKVKYGQEPPQLSPQQLLTCNYMNEGCEGGWPHFNVFLGENGSLVSEECAPYKATTKDDSCSNYKKCEPISKIKSSYLVGGGWGATTEKKMMKELLRNGPMNGDFQAPSMFSIYKEGIFSEKGLIDVHNKANAKVSESFDKDFINQVAELKLDGIFDAQIASSTDDKSTHKSDEKSKEEVEKHHHKNKMAQKQSKKKSSQYSDISLNDKGISWMDMNHSVVIVGWGKDEKTDTRYWIVRNSYGPKWGMDGDFLVKRGNNDFGMEVEQIAFEPHWFQQESDQSPE